MMEVGDENTWFTECLPTYRFNKIIAAETIRFIVTVAIVVYKGLKLVVYRMLTEQTDALQQKIQELLSQIAWLNRQLFGRRSEKLAALDPNQLSLFDPVPATGQEENIREEDSSVAVLSKAKPDGKKKEFRRNRELLEGLPVVEV